LYDSSESTTTALFLLNCCLHTNSFYPTGRSSFGGRSHLARVVDAAASAGDSFGRGSRASGGGHPSSSQQSSMRRKLMSNFIRFGRRAPDYNNNNKTSPSVAAIAA
jgi:hypothetical protein